MNELLSVLKLRNEFEKNQIEFEEGTEQARAIAGQVARENDVDTEDLLELAEEVAEAIERGDINDGLTAVVYSQDSYLETFVLNDMDERATDLFNSIFLYMSKDERANWLTSQVVDHEENQFSNLRATVLIVLHEE